MTTSLVVNCSAVLGDLALPDQLAAVAAAGFTAVEFWWPFGTATPGARAIETFVEAITSSGLELTALNLFAGDMASGERGLVSWPGREDELLANVEVVLEIAGRLGTRRFNALYGNRIDGVEPAAQDVTALANLAAVAARLATIGGTVLLEPLSGVDRYPLRTAADVFAVLDRVETHSGATNLGLLLDVYHLAVNGDDVPWVIANYIERIAHVQVADAPGRGAPGTGELPLLDWLQALRAAGYQGRICLEYLGNNPPLGATLGGAWNTVS